MPSTVTVFAPATVANVASGFDILGFALNEPGDEVTASRSAKGGVTIESIEGDGGKLPWQAERNTAGVPVLRFLEQTGITEGVSIRLRKMMPLGSGLGSSAASAAAAAFAVNELFDRPLSPGELVPFALEGERVACGTAHADNAAPSLLGGFVLIRNYSPLDLVRISAPAELWAAVIHPDIEVRTEDARRILKKRVFLKDAVTQWGNTAGLIAGLLMSD
ncbi:MAG: homoserine kinase, partial [Myxococcota bacterium]